MDAIDEKAEAVRSAFRLQADYCTRLDSPFTALICETLARCVSAETPAGRAILQWPGDPDPLADGLPLRVAGALHALSRGGADPALAALSPPNPWPGKSETARAIERILSARSADILAFIRNTPQTNEVGRSAALMPGLLEIARRTGLPLSLHDIGASAGLNLIPDRYRYRFGEAEWGDPQAVPLLVPQWTGPPPPVDAPLRVLSRRGCDREPIDLRLPASRERLAAYVWPDQRDRMERLQAAMITALQDYRSIDRMEAAEWVESRFAQRIPGQVQVLFHSIVWNYLPPDSRERIMRHMKQLGAGASADAPLAWLRLEHEEKRTKLRLSLWPGEEDELLALAHPHGGAVEWLS